MFTFRLYSLGFLLSFSLSGIAEVPTRPVFCPATILAMTQEKPKGTYPHVYTGILDLFFETGYEGSPFSLADYRGVSQNLDHVEGIEGYPGVDYFYSLAWLHILKPGDYVRILHPTSYRVILQGELKAITTAPYLAIGSTPLDRLFEVFQRHFPAIVFSRTPSLPHYY